MNQIGHDSIIHKARWSRAAILVMICTSAHGFQQATRSADSQREKDVDAIYSLMMTNPETRSRLDNNERYLIAATTSPGYPEKPCVRAPIGREADLQELLADFESRKAVLQQLKPTFSSNKPYVLLSTEEVSEFMRAKLGSLNQNNTIQVQLISSRLLTFCADKRTLALTAISTWCGDSCAVYRWKVFEKLNDGKWEERKTFYSNEVGFWVTCVTLDKRR